MFNTLFLWVVLFVGATQDVRVTVGDVSMSGSVVYESDMCYYIAVNKLALETTLDSKYRPSSGVFMDKDHITGLIGWRPENKVTNKNSLFSIENTQLFIVALLLLVLLLTLPLYGKYSYWMAVAKENTATSGWQAEAEWLREEVKRKDIDREESECQWKDLIRNKINEGKQ